jgi:hypothetical protein
MATRVNVRTKVIDRTYKSHAGTRLALLGALRMGADSIPLCVVRLRPSVTRKAETKLRLVRWDAFL